MSKLWSQRATITLALPNDDYEVTTEQGRRLRRNRVLIRPRKLDILIQGQAPGGGAGAAPATRQAVPAQAVAYNPFRALREPRARRPPLRLDAGTWDLSTGRRRANP
jgi:hypothetical protein